MPVDKGSRVSQLGILLEHKNRSIRQEAVAAFSNFVPSDQNTRNVLLEHLVSTSWEARVSSSDALGAVLKALPPVDRLSPKTRVLPELQNLSLHDLMLNHRPLLSASTNVIDDGSRLRLNVRQQRALIDQHLDFLPQQTGQTSNSFISDSDVLAEGRTGSPRRYEQGQNLAAAGDLVRESVDAEQEDPDSLAINELLRIQLSRLADEQWQTRHGASLAMATLLSSAWNRIHPIMRDTAALRILQVLALDRFIDFVSGRAAAAPVRESAAQALAHYLFRANEERRTVILHHLKGLLGMDGEQVWVCRQSALLVMKYHFVITPFDDTFSLFFGYVVEKLSDPVDDVVSTAVTALSSLFENSSVQERQNTFIVKVGSAVWELLSAESKKEQLHFGMDMLAVDLLRIIERWMAADEATTLSAQQLFTITSLLDAAFISRSHKCVRLIGLATKRGVAALTSKELFNILKQFYRILLFAAPENSLGMLEEIYLTALCIIERYRDVLADEDSLLQSIGFWISCLMLDHRSPMIDVFTCHVDGASSLRDRPEERMCSEEISFLDAPAMGNVYITRKILAAKFLAPLLIILYGSKRIVDGQDLSYSIQMALLPFIQSNALYQNLGAALLSSEFAGSYKVAIASGQTLVHPVPLLTALDALLRVGQKNFDELAGTVAQLTKDCNNFIIFCCGRGADRNAVNSDDASIEETAGLAYEQAMGQCTNEKSRTAIEQRYRALQEGIEYTRAAIRTNTTRIYAFAASTLFSFGCIGEKFTPLIRPLIDTMQTEENETVTAEVFKAAVPLLIVYSAQRAPKPYVKVIAKTVELFASCTNRVPVETGSYDGSDFSSQIISLTPGREPSCTSKNAELFLHLDQLPEFYEYFDLDADINDSEFILRLELHRALWMRVGSRFSDKSTTRVLSFLSSPQSHKRHAAAKAITTFLCSSLVDTLERVYSALKLMVVNLEDANARRGALETLLCISRSGNQFASIASLLAPLAFPRLADLLPEVRDAAAEAFRNFVPMLTLAKEPLSNLGPELLTIAQDNASFIHAWNYAILDEGHVLRNTKTAIWRAANELTAESRLILSGTPVQNSAADLWALFAWLMPGYLGDEKQFRTNFLRAILKCRSPKAGEKEMQAGTDALARLHRLALPFVLRRMKQDVLPELPEKIVQDYECELTEAQRTLYKLIADRCTMDSERLNRKQGLTPLHTLLSLRKVLDHPSLIADIIPRLEADTATARLAEEEGSGKMAALGELLTQCGIGVSTPSTEGDDEVEDLRVPQLPHRALIFCQWVSSVKLVADALSRGTITEQPVAHMILDGTVPANERQSVVERFNSDHSIDVLVLTTHIGGIGLNLTGADVVIFLDHDWNPMKDLQAIDRAHRLGQKRQVMVYRLITKGTIEQKVLSYQHFKRHTAQSIIGSDNQTLQSMATDELMTLFALGDGDSAAKKFEKPPDRKKARIEKMTGMVDDTKWTLSEMWDESQYLETSDVQAFARATRSEGT
ncbi:unnamed protein product, partial [Mesorhabditis spiculigera]